MFVRQLTLDQTRGSVKMFTRELTTERDWSEIDGATGAGGATGAVADAGCFASAADVATPPPDAAGSGAVALAPG